jgi:hypothetical protein
MGIGNRRSRRSAQPQVLVDLAQQQQPATTAEITTAEVGVDHATTESPEIDLRIRTLWHGQSSVGIGGQIPMTTRLGTSLPTSN